MVATDVTLSAAEEPVSLANPTPVGAVGVPVPARVQLPPAVPLPPRVVVLAVKFASVRNQLLFCWSLRMMPYWPFTKPVP